MAVDRHLNCFYSYDQDDELIEDNLTRALIVTLRGVYATTRHKILSSLGGPFEHYDFGNAEFALQRNSHVPTKAIEYQGKHIVTVGSDASRIEWDTYNNEDIRYTLTHKRQPPGSSADLRELCHGSRPDAWIYDSTDRQYCFLIESKLPGGPLDVGQVIRHAHKHYGLDDVHAVQECTISLTWQDILRSLVEAEGYCDDSLDAFLIQNCSDFMSYFGLVLFRGLDLRSLSGDYPGVLAFGGTYSSLSANALRTEEGDNVSTSKESRSFFEHVRSTNLLFSDLKTLLTMIADRIDGYEGPFYSYDKSYSLPSIPKLYHCFLRHQESEPNLNISIILDNEDIESDLISVAEPSIFFLAHSYCSIDRSDWYWPTTAVLWRGSGDESNNLFHGTIKLNGEDVRFCGLIVPLSVFARNDGGDLDHTEAERMINELVVKRVNEMLALYYECACG